MAVLRGGAPHIGRLGRLDIVTSADEGKTGAHREPSSMVRMTIETRRSGS